MTNIIEKAIKQMRQSVKALEKEAGRLYEQIEMIAEYASTLPDTRKNNKSTLSGVTSPFIASADGSEKASELFNKQAKVIEHTQTAAYHTEMAMKAHQAAQDLLQKSDAFV